MYRNFYKLLESQYLFGHFLDEPNGMMEYWNIGYEKRKTNYSTRNVESTEFDDARQTPIFCFYPNKYSIKT